MEAAKHELFRMQIPSLAELQMCNNPKSKTLIKKKFTDS